MQLQIFTTKICSYLLDMVAKINAEYDTVLACALGYSSFLSEKCFEENDEYKVTKVLCLTHIVYLKKYDLELKRDVIKSEDSPNNASFEGEIATKMNHDNIVKTYLAFRQKHGNYEYQWTLSEKIHTDDIMFTTGLFKDAKRYKICADLCRAVQHLNKNKIAHLFVHMCNIGYVYNQRVLSLDEKITLLSWYKALKQESEFAKNGLTITQVLKNNAELSYCEVYEARNAQQLVAKYESNNEEIHIDSKMTVESDPITRTYKLYNFECARYVDTTSKTQNKVDSPFYGCFPDIAPEIVDQQSYSLLTDVYNVATVCYQLHYGKTYHINTFESYINCYADFLDKRYVDFVQKVDLEENIILRQCLVTEDKRIGIDVALQMFEDAYSKETQAKDDGMNNVISKPSEKTLMVKDTGTKEEDVGCCGCFAGLRKRLRNVLQCKVHNKVKNLAYKVKAKVKKAIKRNKHKKK